MQRFTILISLGVAILVVLPQIWAYFATPPGHFFSGIDTVSNWSDIQGVYFAAIKRFAEGDWFYRNPYNPGSQPIFHYPVYLFLGKIAGVLNLPPEFVYHAFAFLLTFIFALFIFEFLKQFFVDRIKLLLSFGWVFFGGLFFFAAAEGTGLFSLMIPHFAVSEIAFFSAFYLILLSSKEKRLRFKHLALLGAATLILAAVHPWMTILLLAFCFIWVLLVKQARKNILIATALIGFFALPFVWYYATRIPWVDFVLPTSNFMIFWQYGPLLLVALVGLVKVLRERNPTFLFIAVWFLVQFAFLYLPLPFARRFIEGLFLPIAILSVVGIDFLIEKWRFDRFRTPNYIYAFIYLSIGVLASYLALFFGTPKDLIYRPVGEKEALRFIERNSLPTNMVFSLPLTGNFIASRANVGVYVGHGIQTPNFLSRARTVEDYFEDRMSGLEREELFLRESICFVYVGPAERKISKIDFSKENYLEKFYENSDVEIYRSRECRPSPIAKI